MRVRGVPKEGGAAMRDGAIVKMTRPHLKFDANSGCRRPTNTGPTKSKTPSPKSVGKPEFRRTR
eukprot:6468044-Pyramimonas_sp.AAC.1